MAIFTGMNKALGGTEKESQREQFFYGLVQQHVLVTGADGQLGSALRVLTRRMNLPFRFFFTGSGELDITNRTQVDDFVVGQRIRYILNCAAYTAVDKAESDREKAYAINAAGVENIALVANQHGVKLIHLSTDFVFDGRSTVPYNEESEPHPLSVYGETKLKGEQLLQAVAGDWIVLRTSWLFSEYGSNFVKRMLRLMQERKQLTVVDDQRGTPTYAVDLAEMMIHILRDAEANGWKTGIYHFSNRGETSWFGFAEAIRRIAGIEHCEILPVSTGEYPTAARRPPYSVLDLTKICDSFRVEIPTWEEALQRCIRNIQKSEI
ncbi:MAG: dTDP-4-dehydrorhamnose reductase [bacterium]|nr:dTDP-4-dehydrorhamnose reductase [bacterium]MDD3968065.1 dTDP-4-dehydrorhamnose reductase [Proteiniphilum sp.]MDD4460007.1 dTDP-4-dehydrorhamnose reductase [Proteiniphilum sp.]